MVGVPRSHGCLLCVKRRVKCDEARAPGCGNCAKYGAECPGYERGLKFVAGKHQIRSRRRIRSGEGEGDGSSSPSSAEDSNLDRALARAAAQLAIRSRTASVSPPPGPTGVPPAVSDNRALFVSTMIENLSEDTSRLELMFWGPWFDKIPPHLGSKITLDSAMCAVTMHLLGKSRHDQYLIQESRSLYGQSLAVLQQALNHPAEWKTSETLCATMLLCIYELFADTASEGASWMRHAAGVSWLIQQRGPNAYIEDWDKAMLSSFRSMIIMNSLFGLQDCFLASKKWQKVMAGYAVEQMERKEELKDVIAVMDLYNACLARLPTVLKYGFRLRETVKHGMPIDWPQVTFLLQYTSKLHDDFLAWFVMAEPVLGTPTEVPSQDPSSPYETVLSYDNLWYGAGNMGYWASMIIIQEVLNQIEQPPKYEESNRRMARNIYRSVESVSQGMMGPFRVGFSVRVAYDFADIPTQIWIRSSLDRMCKTYGATNSASYPPPAPNEHGFN